MDFARKDIHTSVLKESKNSQFSIDDDFNIPDYKEDIEKVVAKSGNVIVDEVFAEDGKVKVNGKVCFHILYQTKGEHAGLECYEGEIPFEDIVNADGATRNSLVTNRCKIEDLTVNTINSRKVEVRMLLGNAVQVYEEYRAKAATDLENGQGVECKFKKHVLTELVVAKQDMFRLKEELDIPQSKPNIKDILWSSVALRNMETKPQTGHISVRGEVECFALYRGLEEQAPIQYIYSVRTINRELECPEATEDMVLEAECKLGSGETSIRQDADGEDRVIGIDYCVTLGIKLYEDRETKLLADLYSPQVEISPELEAIPYENLTMRNLAKAKVNHRMQIATEEKILQICHTFGDVETDDVTVYEDHVTITGVVKANILYIASDEAPMKCMEEIIPFEYVLETGVIPKGASVRMTASIDLLGATLLSSEEMEIKAQINLDMSVFACEKLDVIIDMTVMPIDYEKKSKLPGIVGYIVKPEDTLWSIARTYYATTESIRRLNHLEDDTIHPGDRLIVVKS